MEVAGALALADPPVRTSKRSRPAAPGAQAAKRRVGWPLPGLPATILALVAAQRGPDRLARRRGAVAPQTASLYAAIGLPVNLRGLAFANVTTAKETNDGVPVLLVEGTIVSIARKRGRRAAPALRGAQPAAATRSIPGPRCRAAACWRPARRWPSARGSPRRRPRPATCWCASSTAATSSPASSEGAMARILIAEDERRDPRP